MKLDKIVLILVAEKSGIVDFNHNFKTMKGIYKILNSVDSESTKKLHDEGIVVDRKKIKPFNNHLFFEKAKYRKEGIEVKAGDRCKFTISGDTEILNNIIRGLMNNEKLKVGEVLYSLKDIEEKKNINFKRVMLYKARNPVVETIFNSETKRVEFLSPFDMKYYEALGKNLLRKYEAVYGEKYKDKLYFEIENFCKVKKKMIKNINKNGILIGYTDFEIYIEASKKMQEVAYTLGLGQNGFLGMGHISYICGRSK